MANIGIRLTEAQRIELEERSARFGGSISDYVKSVLFGGQYSQTQEILHRLDELESKIATAQSRTSTALSPARSDTAMMMLSELVILMRMSIPPDKMRGARAELDRLQVHTWEPEAPTKEKPHG